MGNKASNTHDSDVMTPTAPNGTSSSSSSATQSNPITSTSTATTACQYCGIFCADADYHSTGSYYTCKRCGGLLPYYKQHTRPTISAPSDIQLPLQRLHILPFNETLPDSLMNCTEHELLQQYTQPYFQLNRPYLHVNSRLQINHTDFKVVACHPPAGIVTPSTNIRAMGRYLKALQHVTKLQVLPSKASVQSLPQSEQSQLTPEVLFQRYIRPYFNSTIQSGGDTHHCSVGDTFMSNGLQFKVVAATPDNGTVDSDTEIFTDGEYLDDIKKIHVLPIYESLPNNEKSITAQQSFDRYIAPYFLGRMQYVSRNEILNIDGVQYIVKGITPDHGIVTLESEIYCEGQPLHSEDVRRQQEVEDARIARQLAQQDMPNRRNGRPAVQRGGMYQMPLGGNPEEFRVRMAEILRIMPADDQHRRLVQQIHDELLLLPYLPHGTVGIEPRLARIMQSAIAVQQPVNNGVSQVQLDSLPTRKYVKPAHLPQNTSSDDKDHSTCMVCLAEYDDGDELRTLPCFHTFHSSCIDMWLKRKGECPVCRHKL